jgi:hypothetical protein
MMSPSLLLLVALILILGYKAKQRNDGSIGRAYERFKRQIAQFLPRMILVIIGTGFLLQIIPTELISTHLGKDAAGYQYFMADSLVCWFQPDQQLHSQPLPH